MNISKNWAQRSLPLALAVLGAVGCGMQSFPMAKETRLSRKTVGYVSVSGSDAKRSVEITVYHLEAPALLMPGATGFVVWLAPHDGGAPRNLGPLKMQPGGDEPMMTGVLRATMPVGSFDVFITPEATLETTQPQNARLLWAGVATK